MATSPITLIAIAVACWAMVVLTHVAEVFQILPAFGWGRPTSVGHYIDLVSAIIGCTLLPAGLIAWWRRSR